MQTDISKCILKANIQVTSITKENIAITVDVTETSSRKVRFYIYQYGKEEQDDLGTIEVKKNKRSGTATIDLEDIEQKSFEIALYSNEHDKNPISNTLGFTVTNTEEFVQEQTETKESNLADILSSNSDGSDDDYATMYSIEEIVTEQNEETLALEVYKIACEEISCPKRLHPARVFFCKHPECIRDSSIYCEKCMIFKHGNKSHKFDPSAPYIKCAEDFLKPNQTEFDEKKAKGVVLLRLAEVSNFLWHHRWSFGVASKLLIGAGHAVKIPAVSAITIAGPISSSLIAATLGGVGAAFVGCAIEIIYIFYKCGQKKISQKEAFRLSGVSLASNTTACLGFFGVMAVGTAVIGGGTIGWPLTIGAVAAAIFFGLATRYGLNKWFQRKFKKDNDEQNDLELQKLALEYFFKDENYDINDTDKFNDKVLRKKYHTKALEVYPDRDGGDNDEWLKLSGFYGILIGIWEVKYSKEAQIATADDLSEDQRSSIINAEIKRSISALTDVAQ